MLGVREQVSGTLNCCFTFLVMLSHRGRVQLSLHIMPYSPYNFIDIRKRAHGEADDCFTCLNGVPVFAVLCEVPEARLFVQWHGVVDAVWDFGGF